MLYMVIMHETHLASVDLNLLVVLQLLLEERSVTRAAVRLGRTQSAVSRSLGRLRDLLGDPLLVRDGPGLVPTPRAEALAGPLHRILGDIRHALLQPDRFDPARARRTFVLASADYLDALLLPGLTARLTREAPGVRLIQRGGTVAPADAIDDVDLAFGPLGDASGQVRSRLMLVDPFVCLLRRDHRVTELDLAQYLALGHVLVSPRGLPGGIVDAALASRGLERTVTVQVQNFSVAPMVVAGTDLVTTLPRTLALRAVEVLPLRILPPPLPLPETRIHAVWHERRHNDPGHRWLREQVAEVLAASAARPG